MREEASRKQLEKKLVELDTNIAKREKELEPIGFVTGLTVSAVILDRSTSDTIVGPLFQLAIHTKSPILSLFLAAVSTLGGMIGSRYGVRLLAPVFDKRMKEIHTARTDIQYQLDTHIDSEMPLRTRSCSF